MALHSDLGVQDVRAHGAKGDGVTNDYAAFLAAYAALPATGGVIYAPAGDYLIGTGLSFTKPVILRGAGRGENLGGNNTTRIIKNGNLTGITVGAGAAWTVLEDFVLDKTGADSSDGIVVTAGRVTIERVTVKNQGRDGFSIQNANCSRFADLVALSNGRDGIRIDGVDANAMCFLNLDLRINTGVGLNIVQGYANTFVNVVCQGNTGRGIDCAHDKNQFFGVYTESNTGGSVRFQAGAGLNTIFCAINTDGAISDLDGTNTIYDTEGASIARLANMVLSAALRINSATISGYWTIDKDDADRDLRIILNGTGANANVELSNTGGGGAKAGLTATGSLQAGVSLIADVIAELTAAAGVTVDGLLLKDSIVGASGANLGFYGIGPVARPSAYTQTYATADKTHAARTAAALTDSTGETADTTIAQVDAAVGTATSAGVGASTLSTTAVATTASVDALMTTINSRLDLINKNFADIAAQINALRTDQLDTASLVNSLVDDLQALGLVQ